MDLIIVGCGRIGSELAHKVLQNGHRVIVIDRAVESFERLGTEFKGRTICGDVLNRDVLERAGINQADGVAAVTSDDATNFVVARVAKEMFSVPNVVVRAYDPRRRETFEALGIRSIASSSWGAQRLYQLLTHPGKIPLISLGHGEISVVEIQVEEEHHGIKLANFPAKGYPVAVLRKGSALPPDPNLELQVDDLIIISVPAEFFSDAQEVA